MGISENDLYNENDLFKQAEIIEKYFNESTENVLEIGCGKGRNLSYLADKYPNIKFFGIDLGSGQTDIAANKSKQIENLEIKFGDYHNLSHFNKIRFDVVFAIEALCHSNDKSKVADEVLKVLRQNGIFIVFDGYLGVKRENLDRTTKKACVLVEKGMMVDKFENYNVVKNKISKQGFVLDREIDFSMKILPTLYRFEGLANFAFNLGAFSRLLTKLLPSNFTNNAISGYLMPDLIKTGIAKYYLSVYKRA